MEVTNSREGSGKKYLSIFQGAWVEEFNSPPVQDPSKRLLQREKENKTTKTKRLVYYYSYDAIVGVVKDIIIRDSYQGQGKSFLVTIDSGGEEVGLSFEFISSGKFSSYGEAFAKKFGNLYGLITQGQKLTFKPYDIPPHQSKDGKRAIGMSILFNGAKIAHYFTKDSMPPDAQAFQEWDPVQNKHIWNYKNQIAFIYTTVSGWIDQLRAQGVLRPIQQQPAQTPMPQQHPQQQYQQAPVQQQYQQPAPQQTQPVQQYPQQQPYNYGAQPAPQHQQPPVQQQPGYGALPAQQYQAPPVQQQPGYGYPPVQQQPPQQQRPMSLPPQQTAPPPPPPPGQSAQPVHPPVQNTPMPQQQQLYSAQPTDFVPLGDQDLPF